jgi:hypothetical protein
MTIKYEDNSGFIIIEHRFSLNNLLNEFRLNSVKVIENSIIFEYVSGIIKKFDLLEAFNLGLIIEHPNCYCRKDNKSYTHLNGNFYIPKN